ncbi:MAG: hypothetical protein KH452_01095 [Clostridiales bacterium]|nr:hypothetical protein [Clostridiales bacterium]
MKEQVYLLEQGEFLFLAAAPGIQRLYGFELKTEELKRESALLLLQDLTAKGYLSVMEEHMQTTEPLRSMFLQMEEAETVMEIHKKSGRTCIIYLGAGAVRVSRSLCRNKRLELQRIPREEVWFYLNEEGWIL